ncbi:MAG: oligoendopeptidase F [Spirochaetaceae bacterium]|jgi:oligoendopeptidase F|nr:oligoendopeptidase F [Spirochaetaceae bacterium]
METIRSIPLRSEIKEEDTWDLSRLYAGDEEWARDLETYIQFLEKIPPYRGTLGGSAEALADFLDFYRDLGLLEERLGYYSDLRETEDEGSDVARAMTGKFAMAAAKIQAALSWAVPEIQALPDAAMEGFLSHPRIGDYRVYLKKLLRFKPHILSDKEEHILALHAEGEDTANQVFSVLTNVDLDFGFIDTPEGRLPLSQSTWTVFMENPSRDIRQRAYKAFYGAFHAHKTTLGALYSGSVKQDLIRARIRGYGSARAAALFPDNVSEAVYDNLIAAVNANLGPLHRYYRLRKRILKLEELRHYDVYVPLVPGVSKKTSWNEAVNIVSAALAPLGDQYVSTLRCGLRGRWADRYENKGKRSGAFSAGSYTGDPYILMNYKDDTIRDVFTLAHEGGHSMHSWYSAANNPFMQYNYTIFEAEVASTFNEELLFRHLEKTAATPELRRYIVNKRADDFLSTLYRQTMFAEFEKRSHELEEGGVPLTLEVLRGEYRKLLEKYFGPEMVFEDESDLEGLRIPHFYRAFYVYKYATGISASCALAERVLSGGEKEREDYFAFLKSGGSRFPMESLKRAGVDMSSPAPVEAACRIFGALVDQLETLL